jgi:hypothetical protein
MKLTKTQEIVLNKLNDEWQNAYNLQCSLATLNKLVKLGLVEIKEEVGSLMLPRNCKFFRKKLQGSYHKEIDRGNYGE